MNSEVSSTNLESVGRKKVSCACAPKRTGKKTKKWPRKRIAVKR
jgi:hypothetical protein